MKPEDELKLSFYRSISDISNRKNVTLVQHIETKELFVRKDLKTYDRDVFEALKEGNYPFIPKIAEIIYDENGLVVIEEYIQGKNLDDILKDRLFSEEETRELIKKICEILKPIHNHIPAITHRDIKPGNIILQGNQPFIIDFDISRDYDPNESKDTVLMGTKEYAAPEQFGFSQSTPRTDIYAIGVLMNVMMTGKGPSDETVDGDMGRIIRKCTAIDPDDRYISVGELVAALEGKHSSYAPPGFRAGRPILIIIAGLWYLMIIVLSFTMDVTRSDGDPAGPIETIATRIAAFVILAGMTLYIGNYLSVLEKFPFKRSSLIPLEILRVLLGCAIIFFVPIAVVAIVFS